jgi:heat shock protein HslJ
VLPLLLVAAPAACSDDGGTAPDMAELEGRNWFVASITEDGVERPIVDGTDIALRFERGRVHGDAGCNGMSGDITFDGDELVLEELGRELMLCEPEALMEQEDWLAALLLARPSMTVVDDDVTMEAGSTTVALTRAAP